MIYIVNEKRPILRHIIKFENTENKENILRVSREGKEYIHANILKLECHWTSQWQHWKLKNNWSSAKNSEGTIISNLELHI